MACPEPFSGSNLTDWARCVHLSLPCNPVAPLWRKQGPASVFGASGCPQLCKRQSCIYKVNCLYAVAYVSLNWLTCLRIGRQHPSERALHGLLKGRAGMPPKARAKGVAAKAKAKAAAAGKAKARARGLGGGGAVPKGALLPPGPPPVATRRWVHCGWDAVGRD